MIDETQRQKVLDLLNEVEATAREEGRKEAQAEFEARLQEEKQLSWSDGYREALKAIGQTPVGTEPSEPSMEDPEPESRYCLTNPMVAAFMAHEYPADILTSGKSVVDEYISRHVVENNYPANAVEHPLPVVLGTAKDDVYLKGGGHVYQGPGGNIYNLVPGRTYEGTVGGKPVKITTTGTVRQIHFEDVDYIPNCRDIGGYACEGGIVKYGRFVRCAKLPKGLTKDSPTVKILKGLGVTCEIDLRGAEDASPYDNLGWRGYRISVNGYSPAVSSPKNYKTLFERVLKEVKQSGCVLLHCSAGADRTGFAAAMFLAVLGVDPREICKDYELTCACFWCNFKRIDDERFKEFPTGELRSGFKALAKKHGTKGETIQQQAYNWWTKKVGVTAKQIDEFKAAMILKS